MQNLLQREHESTSGNKFPLWSFVLHTAADTLSHVGMQEEAAVSNYADMQLFCRTEFI